MLRDVIYKQSHLPIPRGFLLGTEMLDTSWLNLRTAGDIEEIKSVWVQEVENAFSTIGTAASVFTAQNQLITYVRTEALEQSIDKIKILNELLEKTVNADFLTSCCMHISGRDMVSLDYQRLVNVLGRAVFTNEKILSVAEKVSAGNEELPQLFSSKLLNMLKSDEPDFHYVICELIQYAEEAGWTSDRLLEEIQTVSQHKLVLKGSIHSEEEIVINTAEQLEKRLLVYIKTLHEKLMADYQQGGTRLLMVKASAYIKEHFNHDLKASEVADVIHVSPNYFSQIIKQEKGMHFNDYLHSIRLEHAKELLKETSYRVFEIGEMVGYKEYKYFVHIFKKFTGESPTQFRKSTFQVR